MLLNDVHLSSLRVFVVDKAHTKSMVSFTNDSSLQVVVDTIAFCMGINNQTFVT